MRLDPSYHPDFGASPRLVREFDLDIFTARQILAGAEDARRRMRAAGRVAYALLSAPGALAATHETRAAHEARFLACLDDLLDDWIDQAKLEEAGEVAG